MGNYLARFVEHFRPLRDCVGKVRLRDDMLDSMCSKTLTHLCYQCRQKNFSLFGSQYISVRARGSENFEISVNVFLVSSKCC